MVHGAPAFNHFVYTDCGGVDGYNKLIIRETLEEISEMLGESIATKIEAHVRRSNITRIG